MPPVKEPLLTLDQLVENPPQGFDYVKRFYQSCTAISTKVSSSQVLRTKRKSFPVLYITNHRFSLGALKMECAQRRS